jgi:hypothetical protein
MNEDLMLVGHLPYMAKLAGLLLCGDKEKTPIDFKMGGIVCLMRFDDGRWALEWMLVPDMVGWAFGGRIEASKPDKSVLKVHLSWHLSRVCIVFLGSSSLGHAACRIHTVFLR